MTATADVPNMVISAWKSRSYGQPQSRHPIGR